MSSRIYENVDVGSFGLMKFSHQVTVFGETFIGKILVVRICVDILFKLRNNEENV